MQNKFKSASETMHTRDALTNFKRKVFQSLLKIPGPIRKMALNLKKENQYNSIQTFYFIDSKVKGAYLYIPKNASSTIIDYIISLNDGKDALRKWIGEYEPFVLYPSDAPHNYPAKKIYLAREQCRLVDFEEYFKFTFTFVRNPWSRIVSLYNNKILDFKENHFDAFNSVLWNIKHFSGIKFGDKISFEEFVESIARIPDELSDSHFTSQCFRLKNRFFPNKNRLTCDYIGKIENIEEGFNIINNSLGSNFSIEKKLQSSKRADAVSDYYTDRLKKLIAIRFEEDIDTFKYKLE